MRVGVVGAGGKMGRAVVRAARPGDLGAGGVTIVCAIDASHAGADVGELAGIGRLGVAVSDDLGRLESARPDVVVDFSSPSATSALASIAAAAGAALVSGTTGLGEDARAALRQASASVPVLWEPNMSVGVSLLVELVARAAAALPDWDIEIIEAHHRAKADAPSGTALRLAQRAGQARSDTVRLVHGRQGRSGARVAEEIGVHAVRGGDVVGDHVACLFGEGERIELVHRATSREIFAQGALRAARWIAGKPPGMYALTDALGETAQVSR